MHYGLLKHEIRNLKDGKDQDGKTISEKVKENWQRLSEFLFGESREIVPRNFLAHAGFERNSLELKKSEKGILVRYHESTFDRIKEVLKLLIILLQLLKSRKIFIKIYQCHL